MRSVPDHPKIYHITHMDNLPGIVEAGCVRSDAERIRKGLDAAVVGLTDIKQVRLTKPVPCRAGTSVGQYVPFYLCPRSVMLYILHMGNYPGLTYRGGQSPIVHLEADMGAVVDWADETRRPWAFTDANARAGYARFFRDLDDLSEVNWGAVKSTDFRDPVIKEGKQAEFLVYELFPWELVERIGVHNTRIKARVEQAMGAAQHKPLVTVEQAWYY